MIKYPNILLFFHFSCSVNNTVFKSLTDAVRESEIQQHDPSHVLEESRSS